MFPARQASTARYARPFKDAKREASERAAQTIMGDAADTSDNVVTPTRLLAITTHIEQLVGGTAVSFRVTQH